MAKKRMKVIDDINEVVMQLGIPPHKWEGNCMWIATECYLHRLVPKSSRVCYGFYLGEISENSRFADRAFSHHAWIELPNFTIYDPTRWVFTASKPAIWRGPARHPDYDLGGSSQYKHVPPPMPIGPASFKISDQRRRSLKRLLPWMNPVGPDQAQWYWLAHRHPDELGDLAKWIYTTLKKHKLSGIIPIDFRRYVFRINPSRNEVGPTSAIPVGVGAGPK